MNVLSNEHWKRGVMAGMVVVGLGGAAYATAAPALPLTPMAEARLHPDEPPPLLAEEVKEFGLFVTVDIDTQEGVGSASAKAQLSLDHDETGTLLLGKKRVEVKPVRRDGGTLLAIDVYDDRDQLAYHSVIPFKGMAEVKAKLGPSTGIHKIDVSVTRQPDDFSNGF